MVLVLVASMALAVLVRRQKLSRAKVKVDPAALVGTLRIGRPSKWALTQLPDRTVVLQEPAERGGRTLTIIHEPVQRFMSPLEYMVRREELDPAEMATARPVDVAGWPGTMVVQTHYRKLGAGQSVAMKRVLAGAVLPTLQAVVVRLDGEGRPDEPDEEVVRKVAATIRTAEPPKMLRAEPIAFEGEVRVTPPDGLAWVAADPFRVDRSLVALNAPAWMGVTLTPCWVLPGTDPGEIAAQSAMLDPGFQIADRGRVDASTWIARRQHPQFPAIVYLRVGPHGRAVLAEFRWSGVNGAAAAEGLWEQLAGTIQFPDADGLSPLRENGREAMRALPRDWAALVDPGPDGTTERWQSFSDWTSRDALLRIHYALAGVDQIAAEVETSWPTRANLREGLRDRWTFRRTDPMPTTRLTARLPATAPTTGPATRQFVTFEFWRVVPGVMLPRVLGRLPYEPMVMYTDWLPPTFRARGAAAPLMLIAEPSFEVPRRVSGQEEQMKCWAVRVNGSGAVARWYYDAEGDLQIIALPGGEYLQRKSDAPASRPTTSPATRASQ